ncbi:MAG: GTPase ObgE [Dehalococcoidia bacterium]
MIDQAHIQVAAGRGGDGAVSFHREKFVPRGGPDGGDGGRGGDVVFIADRSYSTLRHIREGQTFNADDGGRGGPNQRRGASARSLELRLPVGTVVWNSGEDESDAEVVADLDVDGKRVVVARGGRGGWGNKRFATPTRKTPRFAQWGSEGDRRPLRLELKLLADVGLVGLPNAGKSTLLRAWSAATPKVAPYPFTTLEPELGVVEVGYETFVAADMPGLIEGASQGVGLGHEFLRHIERTRVLVHVLDMMREDPAADRDLIDAELSAFGHGLAEKPQLVALNKIDDPEARERAVAMGEALEARGTPWLAISAATREGTNDLAQRAWRLLQELRGRDAEASPLPVLQPEPRRQRFEASRAEDGTAVVTGNTPEWLANTLNLADFEARQELFDRLRKLGVGRALDRLKVRPGERIRIGDVEVEWGV